MKHETVIMSSGNRVAIHADEPARLGRATSAVMGTRVPAELRARVRMQAARLGYTPGSYLRALVTLSADPEKAMTAVAKALGVPLEVASPAVIRQALDDLLAALEPSIEPTGDSADLPPSPATLAKRPVARATTLSRDELDACKRLGISVAEFKSRKRNAVKRVR